MRRLKLHHWILIAMLLGAAVGFPLNILAEEGHLDPATPRDAAEIGEAIGTLFLRLLQMVVVPLIVSSLITGITSLGDLRRLGRLGLRTLGYYMMTSALAIVVGIVLVNLIKPGENAELEVLRTHAAGQHVPAVAAGGDTSLAALLWRQLTEMIPKNPVHAAAEGDMLPIIFFSLLFGIFISLAGEEHRLRLAAFFRSCFEVMMKMTLFVIHLAPIGVFGFMLYAAAGSGLSAFVALGRYMLTVFLALVIHGCVTLPLLLLVMARRSPWQFFKAMGPALLTAFSTASSNATLPLTMQSIEERAKIPNRISSFVLPLGATINMDGTALYEAVAVLFIAQATPGIDLSLKQQVVVAITALLASVGAAGIPHAGTVMMVVVLSAVGLPASAVGLILAVDRILDMCRTTVNVWSDATAAAVVARWDEEGQGGGDEAAPAEGSSKEASADEEPSAGDGSTEEEAEQGA